ncbi:DUF5712 family protein [Sphingobacterium multivorum]|uniref:Molybdopterin-guanine dinucleotide biosynthesis protein MobB n=1 Tax=Sphingobacterium multivorum TaxID=28454 RepID=A0A653XJL6_SPHMU|nr:DUF5712 family protein [Sphingobacterium multivorum]VXC30203.1 conserved hypothetical protein [Sphingobacterium multivorum]
MYINITDSETGNNKGSCGDLVAYLEKENRLPDNKKHEHWFNGERKNIKPHEVRIGIDGNIAKLGREDSKFFLLNISPSRKEIDFLLATYGEDGAKEKLKEYAERIMDEYAHNFKRPGIENNKDLLWFAKLENYRYYSHKDNEVKNGTKKAGQRKEGPQMHVQVIVSRKDITNCIKLSPQNRSRGRNVEHSKKLGQFDQMAFKQYGETIFDRMFGFDRKLKETFQYANIMKNGNAEQKTQLHTFDKLLERGDIPKMEEGWTDRILANPAQDRSTVLGDIFPSFAANGLGLLDILLDPVQEFGGQGMVADEEERKRKRKKKKRGLRR